MTEKLATTRRRPGRPSGRPVGAPTLTDRVKLLEAAERVIRDGGPNVSLEAIAAEAGVTKPILYQHVGNKDAVVEALALRFSERVRVLSDAGVATAPDRRTAARCFVGAFFTVIGDDPNLYLYLAAGAGGDGWLQRSLALTDQSAAPVAKALRDERIRIKADPTVATAWSYSIIGMLHHTGLWWIRQPHLTKENIVDQVSELLWGGLRGDEHLDG